MKTWFQTLLFQIKMQLVSLRRGGRSGCWR
jgi:hypothetical protein